MWVPAELELGSFEKWTSERHYNPTVMDLTFIGLWTQNPGEFRLLWGRTIDQPGGRFLFLFLFRLLWLWGRGEELSVPGRHHCRYFNLKNKQNFIRQPCQSPFVADTNLKMYPSLPQEVAGVLKLNTVMPAGLGRHMRVLFCF